MGVVDGATWLRELQAGPARPRVLSHDEQLAIARSLAAAQARASGQRRMDAAIVDLAA